MAILFEAKMLLLVPELLKIREESPTELISRWSLDRF